MFYPCISLVGVMKHSIPALLYLRACVSVSFATIICHSNSEDTGIRFFFALLSPCWQCWKWLTRMLHDHNQIAGKATENKHGRLCMNSKREKKNLPVFQMNENRLKKWKGMWEYWVREDSHGEKASFHLWCGAIICIWAPYLCRPDS